jgi:hypothetical protein
MILILPFECLRALSLSKTAPDPFRFPLKSMIRIMIRSRRNRQGLAASPVTA